jgi:hypothetical protein
MAMEIIGNLIETGCFPSYVELPDGIVIFWLVKSQKTPPCLVVQPHSTQPYQSSTMKHRTKKTRVFSYRLCRKRWASDKKIPEASLGHWKSLMAGDLNS